MLDGGGWLRPLYPVKETRYTLYRRLGGSQGQSRRVRKISPLPGFDLRVMQSAASLYTDWANPACYLITIADSKRFYLKSGFSVYVKQFSTNSVRNWESEMTFGPATGIFIDQAFTCLCSLGVLNWTCFIFIIDGGGTRRIRNEHLRVDYGRIIPKWLLKKQNARESIEFRWLTMQVSRRLLWTR